MPKAYLLYMPPGNAQAMVHYQDTIKNRVALSRISPHISQDLRAKLMAVFGNSPIAVWGSAGGPRNRANFEGMSQGDDILIVEGDTIRLIGKIAAKVESKSLSHELWKPLRADGDTSWELIYFIANPRAQRPIRGVLFALWVRKAFPAARIHSGSPSTTE